MSEFFFARPYEGNPTRDHGTTGVPIVHVEVSGTPAPEPYALGVDQPAVNPRQECDQTMITPNAQPEKPKGRKRLSGGFAI